MDKARLTSIQQLEEDQDLRRAYRLSKKSKGTVIAFAFLFPIGAYMYTGRWLRMLAVWGSTAVAVIFLSIVLAAGTSDEEDAEGAFTSAFILGSLGLTIVAAFDNLKAIDEAQKRIASIQD